MSDTPKVTRRLSLNLIKQADDDLIYLSAQSGLNFTDVVNRAIQIAAFVDRETRDGGQLVIREPGGDLRTVTIL